MGSAGEKRTGRQHLPKVGTAPELEHATERDRAAVEANLGIRQGSAVAWVAGALLLVAAVVAMVAWIALD